MTPDPLTIASIKLQGEPDGGVSPCGCYLHRDRLCQYHEGCNDGVESARRVAGGDGEAEHTQDAEPGGVALHVELTDCPTCGWVPDWVTNPLGVDAPMVPCPTCQTPPTVEGDGPMVEVTP